MAMDMSVALKINAGVTGQQAVDQLRTSMDKLNGAAESVGRGFGAAKMAVGAFIGLQAVQGVMAFARETINAADQLDEMSERTGLAVETLSELEYAAKLNGRTLEDVQAALNRVSVKATDAATGNKAAAIAFDALGVSVKNADGSMRASLQITEDIGAAFREINDPTLKAALAVEIFGKQGPMLVPLLEKMEDARQEARDLGAVVGPEFAKSAAEFNDNMDRMTFMAKGFAGAILADVLPALSDLFKEYRAGINAFGSFGSAMFNIGTQNPFKSNTEHAEFYFNRIGQLEKQIAQLDAAGTVYDRRNADRLRGELETVRKLSQYYDEITNTRRAGAGRGVVNPEPVRPAQADSSAILKKLADANKQLTDAEKAAQRQEQERTQILQGLQDEVTKMTMGERALTLERLRGLGASAEQIAQAEKLMSQRDQAKSDQDRVNILRTLNDEVAKLTKNEDDLLIAKLAALGATDEEILQATRLIQERRKILALDRELEAAAKEADAMTEEAARRKKALADEGKRVFEATRTPAERLSAELTRLNDLLAQGVIDWDTYSRAVFDAQEDFDQFGKKADDTMSDLKQAIEGWGRQATDTFVEFAFTGKATFKDLVNSILQDIARMMIQKAIMQPLMASIGGFFGFASGGIMTNTGPLPLKTYASGGIANSPQVAVFGEGKLPEAYVPLPDGRTIPVTMKGDAGGGATSVVVNVNVESGQANVQDDKGAGELGRLIAGAVKAELINQKRPGGLLAA